MPQLPEALSAIDGHRYTVEPRLAVDAVIGDRVVTAFNDIAVVRYPGQPSAVEALLVTPAAPHSAFNRGLVVSVHDSLVLEVLEPSGRLAVEVDGQVGAQVSAGDRIELRSRPGAAHVVRLGQANFYARARRKLRLTDSAEVSGELPPAS